MSAPVASDEAVLTPTPNNPTPEGARVGFFMTRDKVRLRYGLWPRTGETPRGTICLLQGRTEFIEKYFETIADFQKRGFAVATFDWRGQGGSERLIANKLLGYVDVFDDYWCDLESFQRQILLPDCPPPFNLVAHSMGGLVALEAGVRDRLMFDRMFLSAPMIALDGQPLSLNGMANLADLLSFLGLGTWPAPRQGGWVPTEKNFENNVLTSDRTRYQVSVDTLKEAPELVIGAPTIRWAAAAMRAMAQAAADSFPGRVRIPVLMLAAARDQVVSCGAIENMGLRMRTGKHAVIAGAQHELFMERDSIREQVLAAFDAFITEPTG